LATPIDAIAGRCAGGYKKVLVFAKVVVESG